ncbi:hypothetical protein FB382_004372 [Nocardioides ginsengisegetis]|uniref:Uncharacterized protein n=1 Tax=Nocardioides ginsengisegetis TaxID=661491 RepID=A0A7W3J3K1_9ACTN|nr:hypothetical protein [Nocardioides ginsengisegetis]MBA8805597.1 hypothetical protein [Nocardioides ginsengisegetis]MBA8806021.1 hypothetical protein [Nocardioides ginsengisegetis]
MSTRVACQSCPITLPVEQFVDLVSGGWDMTHTFQRPEFNDGKVVVCRGRFAAPTGPEGGR